MTKSKFSLNRKDDAMAKLVGSTDQKTLAIWANHCAERVLPYFEEEFPEDHRPRAALDACQAWIETGEFSMAVVRKASLDAHSAARDVGEDSAARSAARAAGQAVATAHVATHALAAAGYAQQAVHRASSDSDADTAVAAERDWQYSALLALNEDQSAETTGTKPSFIYLFGLPASGKDYVASILADEFGYEAHDGDEDLTDELRDAVVRQQPFTAPMRDRYYDALIDRISELREDYANLAVAQATFKDRHREQIAAACPDVVFILVEADEAVRMARLRERPNKVTTGYAQRIESLFEPPTHPHFVVTNNGGRDEVIAQLQALMDRPLSPAQ